MKQEDLRAARIAEALRRAAGRPTGSVMAHLADLYETNWTPPEPVSDDLLAARAHAKASGWAATAVDAGSCDHTDEVVSFLAGCTRGREGALAERDEHMAARGELFTRALKAKAQRDAALADVRMWEASVADDWRDEPLNLEAASGAIGGGE